MAREAPVRSLPLQTQERESVYARTYLSTFPFTLPPQRLWEIYCAITFFWWSELRHLMWGKLTFHPSLLHFLPPFFFPSSRLSFSLLTVLPSVLPIAVYLFHFSPIFPSSFPSFFSPSFHLSFFVSLMSCLLSFLLHVSFIHSCHFFPLVFSQWLPFFHLCILLYYHLSSLLSLCPFPFFFPTLHRCLLKGT